MTKDEVIASMAIVAINKENTIYLSLLSTKAAMDEYAKQQAIAFMNWSLQSDCPYSCSDENQWTNIDDPCDSITTEQLHDKFIEQQNK